MLLPLSHCTLLTRICDIEWIYPWIHRSQKYSRIPFDRSHISFFLVWVDANENREKEKKFNGIFFRRLFSVCLFWFNSMCRKTRPNFCGLNPLLGQRFALNHTATEIPIMCIPLVPFELIIFCCDFAMATCDIDLTCTEWTNDKHSSIFTLFVFFCKCATKTHKISNFCQIKRKTIEHNRKKPEHLQMEKNSLYFSVEFLKSSVCLNEWALAVCYYTIKCSHHQHHRT